MRRLTRLIPLVLLFSSSLAAADGPLTEDTAAAELRGHFLPRGKELIWHDGPFTAAMRQGARLVVRVPADSQDLEVDEGDPQDAEPTRLIVVALFGEYSSQLVEDSRHIGMVGAQGLEQTLGRRHRIHRPHRLQQEL